MRHYLRIAILISLFICLSVLVSACGYVIPTAQASRTPSPSLAVTLSSTPTPTITPTPTAQPSLAVLLAAPGADQIQASSLQTSLNRIITASGLRWQVRQQLTPDDLVPGLRLVVVIPPDPGLATLVASAPQTQFLAFGIPGLAPAPNLTTIGGDGTRPDLQGFIAGTLAAMLSQDWRAGVISVSDTAEGRSARTGFLNGVEYFCGLCRPAHPPFYEYPLYIELPSNATSPEWQEAANYMVDHSVLTVYVYPQAGDEAMYSILAAAKINIIGSGEPPQSALPSWVVSLSTDPLLLIHSEVEFLLNGSVSGGQSLAVPIQFTNINSAVFTPGKQRLAQQVLDDLQAGFIETGVDLATGENRP